MLKNVIVCVHILQIWGKYGDLVNAKHEAMTINNTVGELLSEIDSRLADMQDALQRELGKDADVRDGYLVHLITLEQNKLNTTRHKIKTILKGE